MSLNKTQIEWALNPDGTPGYTWNPITGCLNGCEYCYARRLANTRLKNVYLANKDIATLSSDMPIERWYSANITDPFYPRFWEDRLDEPLVTIRRNGKARGIFTCDMSDLFGIGVPEEWTQRVLKVIRTNYLVNQYRDGDGSDRFYLLTKQPQNLIKFSPFPDNAWVGVSATNHDALSSAILYLHNIKAKTKYISFEPLLGSTDLDALDLEHCSIQWVIIGAQTKPTVMPKIEWVREIIEAADKAGVKVFLKKNLLPLIPEGIKRIAAVDSSLIGKPCDVLRQEMPDAGR